jgi:hypothetical protein
MSWDIWLEADLGGREMIYLDGSHMSPTWNLGKIFRAAMWPAGDAPQLRFGEILDGQLAENVEHLFRAAAALIRRDPERFRALEPENGWGTIENALEVFEHFAKWCKDAPRATFRWL